MNPGTTGEARTIREQSGIRDRRTSPSRSGKLIFARAENGRAWVWADDGTSFRVDGEYLEVDPPRLLVHTWIASWSGLLKTVVRWELEPRTVHGLQHRGPQKVGTGTVVKIRQEGFANAPEAARGHAQGWTRILGWMQAFVEKGETVDTRKAAGVS